MATGAIIGGSLISGILGSRGSSRAADAQVAGDQAGIAEQRRQFDAILGLTAPQRNIGNQAMNTLAQAFIPGYQQQQGPQQGFGGQYGGQQYGGQDYGYQPRGGEGADFRRGGRPMIPGGTQYGQQFPQQQQAQPLAANSLSEQFRNLPGAQFMVDQATNQIQNSYGARGGALSGNAMSAIADRTSNIAAGTMFSGLQSLAGLGQSGTNNAVQAAGNQGANVSNLLSNQGAARASGIAGQTASLNDSLQGGIGNYLRYLGTQ